MSTRMSLSNRFCSISYAQFQSLSADFHQLAATVFGCQCAVQVRGLKRTRIVSTHVHHGETNDDDCLNHGDILFQVDDLSAVTASMFDAAAHIEVIVTPMNILAGPKYAFGHIEFKGARRRQATMYLQPGDPNKFGALQRKNASMSVGDGFDTNSIYG